jgi:hypothetical protein
VGGGVHSTEFSERERESLNQHFNLLHVQIIMGCAINYRVVLGFGLAIVEKNPNNIRMSNRVIMLVGFLFKAGSFFLSTR